MVAPKKMHGLDKTKICCTWCNVRGNGAHDDQTAPDFKEKSKMSTGFPTVNGEEMSAELAKLFDVQHNQITVWGKMLFEGTAGVSEEEKLDAARLCLT